MVMLFSSVKETISTMSTGNRQQSANSNMTAWIATEPTFSPLVVSMRMPRCSSSETARSDIAKPPSAIDQNSAPSGKNLRTMRLDVNTRMKPISDW